LGCPLSNISGSHPLHQTVPSSFRPHLTHLLSGQRFSALSRHYDPAELSPTSPQTFPVFTLHCSLYFPFSLRYRVLLHLSLSWFVVVFPPPFQSFSFSNPRHAGPPFPNKAPAWVNRCNGTRYRVICRLSGPASRRSTCTLA